uniref:TPR_REGION domain-containing protein n=1 Tax=Elaeophora elaphi TaxID=1147741 RepID=A0A0R3RLE5_9BILA
MLIDSAKIGIQEPFAKRLLENLMNIGGGSGDNIKDLRIEHDTAYYDELLAMRKYFQETLLREADFCKNLKQFLETGNIFEQASNHISNSNLLAAIENLFKAESVRYHLLAFAQSYKEFDRISKLLIQYYEPIEEIYTNFINEAKYYCTRGIDIIRGRNSEAKKQLEVILRAVEIDEKIDKLYKNNRFEIANRPHCWREMLFKIIEERVQQRVEAFQIEDRKLNQNWVTRYDSEFILM